MIGERLAEVRKDRGDTQKNLAEKMNVSVHTVSSWEQERSEPSHETLVRICRLYGVSSDYLLGLSDADPLLEKQAASSLTTEDQILIKDVTEFLLWRSKKNKKKKR